MKRVLFLVNGLGLGNSTRCHAIMQKLAESGVRSLVATSGNGLWYFRQQGDIDAPVEIGALHYGTNREGRISGMRTILSVPDYLATLHGNARIIDDLVETLRPDAVVTDSTYVRRRGRARDVPLFAVNNADVVHTLYQSYPDRPRSTRLQFYAVEEMDFLYHRFVPDVALSPCLAEPPKAAPAPYYRIGPIVRPACKPAAMSGRPSRILVMLSGSKFGSPVHLRRAPAGCRVDIVGRSEPANNNVPPGCRYLGRVLNTPELAADADVLVVNGGFSAVSEGFVMRKPLIVIPVPNHAEQWVNARTICDLGVGMMARAEQIEDAIDAALANLDSYREAYARLPLAQDGAAQASERILRAIA